MTAALDEEKAPVPSKFLIEYRGPASRRALALEWASRRTAYPLLQLVGRRGGLKMARLANLSDYLGVVLPRPPGVTTTSLRVGECPAEWVHARGAAAPSPDEGAILYFHGGAFIACGLRMHRPLVSRISRASELPVLNVAYRQLPKASVQTSVADGLIAYRHLLEMGHDPTRTVVMGDSAGGFVGIATILAAKSAGLPLPAAMVGLSPFTDFDLVRKAASPNAQTDSLIPMALAEFVGRVAEAFEEDRDPDIDPMQADLGGFPPTLIQASSTELLRDDAEGMARRLAAAGVDCRLQVWDRQIHVFQGIGGDFLPEAKAAIGDIGTFVQQTLSQEKS